MNHSEQNSSFVDRVLITTGIVIFSPSARDGICSGFLGINSLLERLESFSQFGTEQISYFNIKKYNSRLAKTVLPHIKL